MTRLFIGQVCFYKNEIKEIKKEIGIRVKPIMSKKAQPIWIIGGRQIENVKKSIQWIANYTLKSTNWKEILHKKKYVKRVEILTQVIENLTIKLVLRELAKSIFHSKTDEWKNRYSELQTTRWNWLVRRVIVHKKSTLIGLK